MESMVEDGSQCCQVGEIRFERSYLAERDGKIVMLQPMMQKLRACNSTLYMFLCIYIYIVCNICNVYSILISLYDHNHHF